LFYLIDAQVQDDIDDNHTLFSDAAFTASEQQLLSSRR